MELMKIIGCGCGKVEILSLNHESLLNPSERTVVIVPKNGCTQGEGGGVRWGPEFF